MKFVTTHKLEIMQDEHFKEFTSLIEGKWNKKLYILQQSKHGRKKTGLGFGKEVIVLGFSNEHLGHSNIFVLGFFLIYHLQTGNNVLVMGRCKFVCAAPRLFLFLDYHRRELVNSFENVYNLQKAGITSSVVFF